MDAERIIVIFFVAIAATFVLRRIAQKIANTSMSKGDEQKLCGDCCNCNLNTGCNSNRVPQQKNP